MGYLDRTGGELDVRRTRAQEPQRFERAASFPGQLQATTSLPAGCGRAESSPRSRSTSGLVASAGSKKYSASPGFSRMKRDTPPGDVAHTRCVHPLVVTASARAPLSRCWPMPGVQALRMASTPRRLPLPLHALVGLSLLLAAYGTAANDRPPAARLAPVVDDYFGTKVTDPYRWMEAPDNGELTRWLKEQALHTRGRLDRIPSRKALLRRIHELNQSTSEVFGMTEAGGRYFYFRTIPGEPLPKVFFRDSLAGSERLLLDPARLAPAGGHAEIGFLEPSNDGRYLAYGLAFGGSDWGELHVVDVATGESQAESISRIWTGFDDKVVSWAPDNRSFCYQRFPEPGPDQPPAEKQMRSAVYLHTLGRNTSGDGDPAVFGFGVSPTIDVPKEAWSAVWFSADSQFVIAGFVSSIFDVEALFFVPLAELSAAETPWRRIVRPEDQIGANPLFNSASRIPLHGSELYLMSHRDASRFKVLRYDLHDANPPAATVAVPEGGAVLEDLEAAADGLYVLELRGGPSGLRRLAYGESTAQEVPLPFSGTISLVATSPDAPGALLRMRSWTHSNVILAFDPSTGKASDTGWQEPARIDYSTIEAREVKVVSFDGTLVPLSILIRKDGQLDGKHPTLLSSYGGYGSYGTAKPYFDPVLLAWLERGGVVAVAHPRGGGELGEDWHRAGMKQSKLNTVFDTVACAQYLVNEHYASPKTLAVYGASAGGITVGGVLNWRPDLLAAAIDHAGMSDTVRHEMRENGPEDAAEFGSVSTAEGFHGLYAMSPYTHVRDGVPYPAVLLETGINDRRVPPWDVAKMTARLQAATSSHRPVLLRVDFDTGHFGGTADQEEQLIADEWSFLLWQFGDPAFQPRR